jgi:hypothetical protein
VVIQVTDIVEVRERIAEVRAELGVVGNATHIPKHEALARLHAAIAQFGAQVKPVGLHTVMGSAFSPRALATMLDTTARPGALTALLCRMFPERLFAWLKEEVEARYAMADRPVMSEAERRGRISELREELLRLEQAEEQSIRELEAAGQQAPCRRGDVEHLHVVLDD